MHTTSFSCASSLMSANMALVQAPEGAPKLSGFVDFIITMKASETLHEYSPPEWASSVTETPSRRLAMALTPTAIEPWLIPPNLLPADCQTKIFVKRDDKTGVGLSGNKVRKLEFLLADAVQQGCDCVVTIGGGIHGYLYVY